MTNLVKACEELLTLARMLADTESDATLDKFGDVLAEIEVLFNGDEEG
jgi:hypothetical protein